MIEIPDYPDDKIYNLEIAEEDDWFAESINFRANNDLHAKRQVTEKATGYNKDYKFVLYRLKDKKKKLIAYKFGTKGKWRKK